MSNYHVFLGLSTCFLWIDDWILRLIYYLESLHVDKFLRFNMIFIYIKCLNSLIRYDLRIYWMLNLPCNMQSNDLLNHSYSIYFILCLSTFIILSSDYASWLSTLIELKIIQVHIIKYLVDPWIPSFFSPLISLRFILLFSIIVSILSCSIFGWKNKQLFLFST